MRKEGSITNKLCWNLKIYVNDNIIFQKDYTTLKSMTNDLGISYERIVNLANNRIKQSGGKYDSIYKFTKIC
jgi:hypothetical protein